MIFSDLLTEALAIDDPVDRLRRLIEIAHEVDDARTTVADLKAAAAMVVVDGGGVRQVDLAKTLGVTPMLVQQWVTRGRALAEQHNH